MESIPLELTEGALDELLSALRADGYDVLGPRLQHGALSFAAVTAVADLPTGVSDAQTPGQYEVQGDASAQTHFGFCTTTQSLKPFFFPPRQVLFALRQSANGPVLTGPEAPAPLAVLGARGCDLAGLDVLDGVLSSPEPGGSTHTDPGYQHRRDNAFIVAVQCTSPSATCFCAAAGTGPQVRSGFDWSLTELPRPGGPVYLLTVGSTKGQAILEQLRAQHPNSFTREAQYSDIREGNALVAAAAAKTRALPLSLSDAPTTLRHAQEHPYWDRVAEQCLACSNCTMVCPTCFCTDVEETTHFPSLADLAETADGVDASDPPPDLVRSMTWDSCFTAEYSQMHQTPVRQSVRSKYRQWFLHKFSTWWDQFGSSGCVGCGRCVTWCPAGIDVVTGLEQLGSEEGR